MKTSHTKLKSKLLIGTSVLTLAITSLPLMAKPVAQVTEVKGQVFVVTPEGNTRTLKVNDHLEEKSEVMVGEDGDVTLNDYYDATYHMIEGSHLKFFNKSVQLKKGKTWIQSLNAKYPLVLTTANGYVDFSKGEFITTFDQVTSKTQVLVVNGEVEVSNVLDMNRKSNVSAGNFTILDPEEENGLPRSPTKIGLSSLNQALLEFKALPEEMRMNVKPQIASEPVKAVAPIKKGEIVFMTNGKLSSQKRLPASVSGGAHSYMKAKSAPGKSNKLTPAPIRFFGIKPLTQAAPKPRQPASVSPLVVPAPPKKIGADLNIDAEFNQSLRNQQVSNPKYSKELENLIHDLKSY